MLKCCVGSVRRPRVTCVAVAGCQLGECTVMHQDVLFTDHHVDDDVCVCVYRGWCACLCIGCVRD